MKFINKLQWGSNDKIEGLLGRIDFVKDEYSNYYTIYSLKSEFNKLTEVTLAHVLYDEAHSLIFSYLVDELKDKDQDIYLGKILLDRMNQHINILQNSNRKIFTVQELLNEGIKVKLWDIRNHK